MRNESILSRTKLRAQSPLMRATALSFFRSALANLATRLVSLAICLASSLLIGVVALATNAISATAQAGECAQSFKVFEDRVAQMTPEVFLNRWQPVSPSVARSVQALLSASPNGPSAKILLPRLGAIQDELLKDINAPNGFRAILARLGLKNKKQTSANILLANETLRFRKAQLEADLLALSYLAGFQTELPRENQHLSFMARWTEPLRLKVQSLLHSESGRIWTIAQRTLRPILTGTNDLITFAAAFLIGHPHAHRAPYPSPLARNWISKQPIGSLSHAQWTALQTQMLNSTTQAILSESEAPWFKALKPLHWKQRAQYVQTVVQKLVLAVTIGVVTIYADQIGSQAHAIAEIQQQQAELNHLYHAFSDQDLVDVYEQLLVVQWMERGEWSSETPEYSKDQSHLLSEAARLSRPELIKKLDRLRIELEFSVQDLLQAQAYTE